MDSQPIAIYQVLPRLYGNTKENCEPGGTIEQNGCGKLNDFTMPRLRAIKKAGYTHIWYTGIIEHATQTDYSAYGIKRDNARVVKGRAGSPYAIKDYYDVAPDLACDVSQRMKEFEALVARTHEAGLRVIIDFVPNHVARSYASDAKPAGVEDLGAADDTALAFSPQNNFYYIPDKALDTSLLPPPTDNTTPAYEEYPAKASGNDVFTERPSAFDWYETVKLNYGVDYLHGHTRHFHPTPSTWQKMLSILRYWAAKGVDGFRCDMAEMVPVEFWGFATQQIKKEFPDIKFIAEVYNPQLYRSYLYDGGFDFLYDKVGLYDTLREIVCGYVPAAALTQCWQALGDIRAHMLHFVENHDEQRMASHQVCGSALKAWPAFVVAALFDAGPLMVYAGEEFGEKAEDAEGFSGSDGRTTIFDYWSVPSLRRNALGCLTEEERLLQKQYNRIVKLKSATEALLSGEMYDLMYVHGKGSDGVNPQCHYLFARGTKDEAVIVAVNFSDLQAEIQVQVPRHAFEFFGWTEELGQCTNLLTHRFRREHLKPDSPIGMTLPPLGCQVWRFRKTEK